MAEPLEGFAKFLRRCERPAEEVEAAIKSHPGVYDCIVAGRPSERGGNEVVAIVRIRDGHDVDDAALRAAAAEHIARYKLPKEIRYVDDEVGRLLGHLEETGLASRTVTVLTSDHGERFGEEGRWGTGGGW